MSADISTLTRREIILISYFRFRYGDISVPADIYLVYLAAGAAECSDDGREDSEDGTEAAETDDCAARWEDAVNNYDRNPDNPCGPPHTQCDHCNRVSIRCAWLAAPSSVCWK